MNIQMNSDMYSINNLKYLLVWLLVTFKNENDFCKGIKISFAPNSVQGMFTIRKNY